jgi:hydroxymethylpyrimidine/phosphomethylpyrimidine kinase
MQTPPIILSIAGYDPSSGAGITADVKTAAALGCYAVTCITAITVQSTQGVFRVESLEAGLVSQTLEKLHEDVPIAAVRVGMLGSGEVAEAIATFLQTRTLPNVVLDPVLTSSSGTALLDESAVDVLRSQLLPLCDVITPNIHEAILLAAIGDNLVQSASPLSAALHRLGAKAVVITGGDLDPPNEFLSDCRSGRAETTILPGERIESRSTHGTGCAFATALACRLALGDDLREAVRAAKQYVRNAILTAYPLGKGIGPLNHLINGRR